MTRDQLLQLQAARVTAGQHQLANTVRGLMLQAAPDIFDALSDAPDEVFLEPLLFAYFSVSKLGEPPISLPQLVLGSVDEAVRPDAIEVYADARGRIVLPRIGYLLTEERNPHLILRQEQGQYTLEREDGSPVDYRLEAPLTIPGTDIELCLYPSPLIDALLADSTEGKVPVQFEEDPRRYLGALERALALIQRLEPEFYQQLTSVVRQIILFRSDALNSCASLAAHGVAFLNIQDGGDEVLFVDDLVHQCGHVIFNAFTVRRRDFLAVDPDERMGTFTRRPDDSRSVYTVLHGVYTEFFITECLLACDERGLFSGQKGHELRGRLASICQKGVIDLRNLSQPGLLTPQGQQLYDTFLRFSEQLRRERPELLRYNLSNQPYNFSYERFAALNPPPSVHQQ
jgi:hypothetical protein